MILRICSAEWSTKISCQRIFQDNMTHPHPHLHSLLGHAHAARGCPSRKVRMDEMN
jgi:hypothetical protein